MSLAMTIRREELSVRGAFEVGRELMAFVTSCNIYLPFAL